MLFRSTKILQEAASQKDNIHFVWDTIVTKINGDSLVESITISNIKSQTKEELPVQGIFIAVGILPNAEMIPSIIKKDESNYLIANEDGITNIPGIFVAGDIRTKELRQIVTAVSDGANAITSVQRYLVENSK